MKIKRDLATCLIGGFLLSALLWKGALNYVVDKPVSNAIFSQSIIDTKIEAASSTSELQGPRIFLVGGSNVAFGLDSHQIEKEIGMTTINFGCIAGIGPEIVLSSMMPTLRNGDNIIFAWEYGLYRFERRHNDITYMNLLFGPQSQLLTRYPKIDQVYLSLVLPIKHFRESVAIHFNPIVESDIFRCSWKFDSRGNVRSNLGNLTTKKELEEKPLSAITKKFSISSQTKEILSTFIKHCMDHEISIFAAWPNLYNHSSYQNNPVVRKNLKVIEDFWTGHQIPILGKAEDGMMPAEFFYDTFYHLNAKGVSHRTSKLIEDLSLMLE